jgi:hypothetical protein
MLEAFILDKEIPVEELPPPQVVAPVTVVPSPTPESPVLCRGPTPTILRIIEPAVLRPHQLVDESPVIPTYQEAVATHYFIKAVRMTRNLSWR